MADSLGTWLRRTREVQRLDLEDAVEALRIHRRYLQALEMGDYEALPGPIQARGFLRNYARFLGISVDDALARYDAEVRGQPVQPRIAEIEVPTRRGMRTWAPPPPTVEEERAAVRANTSGGLLRILAAALIFFALVGAASFAWLQFGPVQAVQTSEPTPPSAEGGGAPATVTPTVQSTPVFPISSDGMVRVRLIPTSHAWISLSADADIVFQGIAEPDQLLEAAAADTLIVSTGNGGAFRLYVNGTDWGLLGSQGEVVRRAWTPSGETMLEDS
ncbi:MAG: RodZ domain-containing protein [Anaerolineae bacterium]